MRADAHVHRRRGRRRGRRRRRRSRPSSPRSARSTSSPSTTAALRDRRGEPRRVRALRAVHRRRAAGRGAGAQALRRRRRAAARLSRPRRTGAHATCRLGDWSGCPSFRRPNAPALRSSARALLRRIVAVDDRDTYVCRPHAPGEIADALIGRELTARAPPRQGDVGARPPTTGRCSGLHLGMAGRIAVDEEPAPQRLGPLRRWTSRTAARWPCATSAGSGRARLEPDLAALGPDAAEIGRDEFRARVGRGSAPLKARLMDQARDRRRRATCWPTRSSGARGWTRAGPAGELEHRRARPRCAASCAPRRARRSAAAASTPATSSPRAGAAAACPRCGTEMARATVGGRTTYWCPAEQR